MGVLESLRGPVRRKGLLHYAGEGLFFEKFLNNYRIKLTVY